MLATLQHIQPHYVSPMFDATEGARNKVAAFVDVPMHVDRAVDKDRFEIRIAGSLGQGRCPTARCIRRANCLHTLFRRPRSFGRSPQGAPERAMQGTASTNTRLSRAVDPRSPCLPGVDARSARMIGSQVHARHGPPFQKVGWII
jgi:hypothetical protein